uniref:Uncharacterized protein n=1 Tax=Rhizophora mucronata TaxID=61149 RepID=A0A2P2MYH3_RHIMU
MCDSFGAHHCRGMLWTILWLWVHAFGLIVVVLMWFFNA